MTAIEEAYQCPSCAVLTFGGEVVIHVIRTEMTLAALNASIKVARMLAQQNGRGVASLVVIGTGSRIPGPELRKAIDESIKESRQYALCSAQVLRGTGFWVSAVRSIFTALELINPGDLPRRTFDDVPPATRWIAEQLKHDRAWAAQLANAARSGLGTGEFELAVAR